MGNLGMPEMLVIVVVALLVFGPDRLPELAQQAGRFISRFREESSRSVAELKKAAEMEDLDRELRSMREELREVGRELTSGRPTRGEEPPRTVRRTPPPTDPEAT